MNVSIFELRKDSSNDKAILDVLHLREYNMIPGWVSTKDLQTLWGVSQSQVSRRISGIKRLGNIKAVAEYGRYYIASIDDSKLWMDAAMERTIERRKKQAIYRRAKGFRSLRADERKARAVKWDSLRKRLTGYDYDTVLKTDQPLSGTRMLR